MIRISKAFFSGVRMLAAAGLIIHFSAGLIPAREMNQSDTHTELFNAWRDLDAYDWPGTFGQSRAMKAKAIFSDLKMRSATRILKEFQDESSTTRVIINFVAPKDDTATLKIKTKMGRQKLKKSVGRMQAQIMSRMDSRKVRSISQFSFQYGMTADVTLEGLAQLLDDADVQSIEPDRNPASPQRPSHSSDECG